MTVETARQPKWREKPPRTESRREQIDNSSISSRTWKNYTLVRFSYRQYAINKQQQQHKQKRCCAFHHSSLMMWGTSTTQSSPRTYWKLIDIPTKIKKWYIDPVLISLICNKTKNGAVHSNLRPWWCEEPQRPRVHREQIENSSISSQTLHNYTFIQFSYRQYA